MNQPTFQDTATRAGMVALVGRPNVGKSTLLNTLVKERLSIVTSKAQTTWRRVVGIRTSQRAQLVLFDTPGLLEARDLLQRSMLEEAKEAVRDADVTLLVVDASRSLGDARRAAAASSFPESPAFTAVNKIDKATAEAVSAAVKWAETELQSRAYPVSAKTGAGVETLAAALEDAVPPSPFLYPKEHIASQPLRFFAAEIIREGVFDQFEQEVPYSVFCTIDDFRETEDPIYIQATLYVERPSQKQILVGRKGAAIRELGRTARKKIEQLTGTPVFLDLWVKTLPRWRQKRKQLARFGFRLAGDNA